MPSTDSTHSTGKHFPRSGKNPLTYLLLLFLNLLFLPPCQGADVVSVTSPRDGQTAEARTELASQLYGLNVQAMNAAGIDDARKVIDALGQPDLLAAIISANSLPYLDERRVFSALLRSGRKSVPLLIAGLDPETDQRVVRRWSGGAVTGCNSPAHESDDWNFTAGDQQEIVRELAEIEMPFRGKVACGLVRGQNSNPQSLLEASDRGERLHIFMDVAVDGQSVFLLANIIPSGEASTSATLNFLRGFSGVAPEAMYLRYAAGDRAWHTTGHYANLTVDDAWLTEPFGNLDYAGLLKEMEKHNFHTTIAFIPWNYDRSEPDAVALFREHPERFSVCIHGNNHDHREFGEYSAEPLDGQTANIKQALARMEQFTRLTQIPYDRVMVFPHAVAPVETFAVLKEYNFRATTNSESVPLGSRPPASPLFSFRPETLEFANFASIFRYSAEVPVSHAAIAINAYLGSPILFYAHEGYFHPGIGVFNAIADEVNRIEPQTIWGSLGSVTEHLYLIRSRRDQTIDVLSYSSDFVLTNSEGKTAVFHVRKSENFMPDLASLTVNGNPQHYEKLKNEIAFDVLLEPGSSGHVRILYANDLQTSNIPLSKGGLEVRLLRWASDFRDLKLSRSRIGWLLMDFYYRNHLDGVERNLEPWALRLLLVMVAFAALWRFRTVKKSVAGRE